MIFCGNIMYTNKFPAMFCKFIRPWSQTVIRRRQAGMCDCVRAHKEWGIMGKECVPVLEELHGAWTQTATHKKSRHTNQALSPHSFSLSPSRFLSLFLCRPTGVGCWCWPLAPFGRSSHCSLPSFSVRSPSLTVSCRGRKWRLDIACGKNPSVLYSIPRSDRCSYTHAKKTHLNTRLSIKWQVAF